MALRQTLCKHEAVLSKPRIYVNETTKETAPLDPVPTQAAASTAGVTLKIISTHQNSRDSPCCKTTVEV